MSDDEVLAAIDALVAEKPVTDAAAAFEAASARDFLGLEPEAEPLYRRALELGLDEKRQPQAVIQLASTLRNLGQLDESIALLEAQLAAHPDDRWAGPAKAFLALALVSRGDERRASSVALEALSGYLPAYGRSVRAYAAEL
jgi:tetratricopeptide (TPR) repeat protein